MSADVADQPLEPFEASSFPAEPKLECDIVMKGGITSGVIYPLAVCELAKVYRLRSVGGASAGAIAAAAAAAAEVGRATAAAAASGATKASAVDASSAGFIGLANLPDELTTAQPGDGRSLLFHLFRPQRLAKRLFGLLVAAMDGATGLRAPRKRFARARLAAKLVVAGARAFPARAALGAVPGVVVMLAGLATLLGASSALAVVASWFVLVFGIVLTAAGLAIGVLTGLFTDTGRLSDHDIGFGISSGMGERESELALTPWLHRKLQALAGRSENPPLTFGELGKHSVNFQVMTTNLSRNQPKSMPWNDDTYFFSPEEFRKLFPEGVVEHMINKPPPLPTGELEAHDVQVLRLHANRHRKELHPFPRSDDLPILVATRMSLSFPLLISAVPLYAADFVVPGNDHYEQAVRRWRTEHPGRTPEENADAVAAPSFDVNWFSDGGLTANLPVHFFDSPLPTRPTFAIDLAPFAPGRKRSKDERKNLYFPTVNSGGLHRRTAHWEDKKPLSRLVAFGLSLVNTARVWVDEKQLTMPGYRDRIVTVYQDTDEGGLNLSMADDVVDRLSLRGRFAAVRMVERFAGDNPGVEPAVGWDNHRWIRFRAVTGGLSDWLAGFERGYPSPPVPTTSYDTMLSADSEQPSYKIKDGRLNAARARVQSLRAEIGRWGAEPADAFTERRSRPKPPPRLRLVADDWRPDDQS